MKNSALFPKGSIPFPCPWKDGCVRFCATKRQIALEQTEYEDEDGGYRLGICYQYSPFETFEISLDDVKVGFAQMEEKHTHETCGLVKAEVVAVTPAVERKLQAGICEKVVKGVAEAVRNKGGRPRKADHATDAMTQKEVAIMFGPSCTESKVNNWERFDRSGGKVGSMPPSAEYKGHPVSYSADLRKFPTPENKAILAAIIERYKSTAAVKDGIRHKADLHFKNAETAFRGRGGIQTELAKGRR